MANERRAWWWQRWGVAIVVAAALALWPACTLDSDDPPGERADLDFVLKDMNGQDVRLASFLGRPLIVNFWATWCAPCKIEIPAFVELVDRYRAERLTVLGVSVDDKPEDLREFAAAYKMNYPVLVGLGHDRLQEVYDAMLATPVTWFIHPDGTVFKKHQGPASTDWFGEQVKAMLAAGERP
jgi:cytochrome c biogenesis protein CcmG/thiol:disulfide interchange protein DsbE